MCIQGGAGVEITKPDFLELFPDNNPDELVCGSTGTKIEFENAFCIEDPFISEIHLRSEPIIEETKTDLFREYKLSGEEI